MGPLHRPASNDQRTTGWTNLISATFAIGFSGDHHHIGIFKTLIAAIGNGQPGEQIQFRLFGSFALLNGRDIIGLPVKAGCQIGQRQSCGHRTLRCGENGQGRLGRETLRNL